MKQFSLEQVAIENIAYEGPSQSNYQTLKQLVAKMEKDQSFSIPKKYTKNLRTVIHAEFPEIKIKIRQIEGSDFIRAFRVL
jgi:hypothetical protein